MEKVALLFIWVVFPLGIVQARLLCANYIFQFGDSLSDTGNAALAFPLQASRGRTPPYGSAFPGFPTGRYSNGRLIVDWLGEALKVKIVEPYLRSFVPSSPLAKTGDYRYGVSFSVALATAESVTELEESGVSVSVVFPLPINPFTLDVQYQWFSFFKDLSWASTSTPGGILPNLPSPTVFGRGLYLVGEIGVNDYLLKALSGMSFVRIKAGVSLVIKKIVNLIEKLHRSGARRFLVMGLTPQGCTPIFLTSFNGTKDVLNCLKEYNQIDEVHESKLRAAVHKLREKLPDSIIIFADFYGAYLHVIKNAARYGIEATERACCGGGGEFNYNISAPCGSLTATACPNPRQYVYWDEIHFTDSFNEIIAHKFISGEFLDPPGTSLACL